MVRLRAVLCPYMLMYCAHYFLCPRGPATEDLGSQCLKASTGIGEKGRVFPCGSPYPRGTCPVPSLFILSFPHR